MSVIGIGLGITYKMGGGVGVPAPLPIPTAHNVGITTFEPPALDVYAAWSQRPAEKLVMFAGYDTWEHWNDYLDYWIEQFDGVDISRVWTIGLCVVGTSLADVAGGSNDSDWTSAATRILAASPDDDSQIIIRPGHEMTYADVYPWSSPGHEADYIAAFQRFVVTFRAVSTRFRFDWCVAFNPDDVDIDPEDSYPGDTYVDAIGLDVYYMHSQGPQAGNTDPTDAFNKMRDAPYGLQWQADFGTAHHKPLSWTEFGTDYNTGTWLGLMSDWFEAHEFAFICYFDNNTEVSYQTRLSDDNYGLWAAGEAYITNFGTPTWGTNVVLTAPTSVAGDWFNANGVTFSGNRVTSGGSVDYGAREYISSAGLPVGHYQCQVAYEKVSPNVKSLAHWALMNSGFTPTDETFLYLDTDTLSFQFTPTGKTAATDIGITPITAGYHLLTFEVDVVASNAHTDTGAGPGSATSGAAIDFFAMRIRPSVDYEFANQEAEDLVGRFSVTPDAVRKQKIDTLIGDLKAAGVYAKLDALYLLRAHDSQAARQNWIANQYNLSAISSPVFTVDKGYKGDGSSSYLSCNFNPTTATTPKFTKDSSSIILVGDTANFGGGNTNAALRLLSGANRVVSRVNDGTSQNISTAAATGCAIISRSSSVSYEAYLDGASLGTQVVLSTVVFNANMSVCAIQSAGVFLNGEGACFAFGSNLTSGEAAAATTAINAYITAIGA